MCLEKDVLNKIKHTSLSQHFSQVLEWPWSTLIHYRSRNWNSGWSQMALRALFKSNGLSLCFLAYISLASYLLLLLRNWRMKAIKMWKKILTTTKPRLDINHYYNSYCGSTFHVFPNLILTLTLYYT